VIRLPNHVQLHLLEADSPPQAGESPILPDVTCFPGAASSHSAQQHGVVVFQDGHGHDIRVVR